MCKKMMNADTLYKNSRKAIYVYSVDLKERMKVIEKQQNEIQQLKQQIAEMQNTIDEINREFVQAVHDWKTLCKKKDKEISKLQASCQQDKT